MSQIIAKYCAHFTSDCPKHELVPDMQGLFTYLAVFDAQTSSLSVHRGAWYWAICPYIITDYKRDQQSMPFYEYSCDACGHELEELQKINDPALKDCPACSKAKLRKLVSAAAFKLTGTGWYETDFKDQPKKSDSSDSESKSSNAEGGDKTAKKADGESGKKAKNEPKKAKKRNSDQKN